MLGSTIIALKAECSTKPCYRSIGSDLNYREVLYDFISSQCKKADTRAGCEN